MIYVAIVLVILALIPPAIIARTRAVPSPQRRIHLIQDMDNQGKFRAQQVNPMFADDRAMRPPVAGTVAVGQLDADDHFYRGISAPEVWAATFPAQTPVNPDLLKRGQERFAIFCRPCHGDAGYGDGIVHVRADLLVRSGVNGTVWTQPKSLHDAGTKESPGSRVQPVGQLFNTITHGIRNMAGYESQIPVADRWAIVAYVKALQISQYAKPGDFSASELSSLPTIRLTAPTSATTTTPTMKDQPK